MINETKITLVGNLVADPDLRFTTTGVAVCDFRIASTTVKFDRQSDGWKDNDTLFLTCTAWRDLAENIAETLQRGMRAIVQGRLKQRSYETREGDKRTVFEIDVEDVGPSLRNASAKVTKTQRHTSSSHTSDGTTTQNAAPNASQSPWGDFGQNREPVGAGAAGQGWSGAGGGYSDDPPF
ncbi:single-stranded DNA-binding protein [Actinomadura violacea]|uniref:Single-stranded DNA-binding protein n=1 Tax=Actinomadura violacea TaxID=2819934 RepID=A0ABS3S7M4_9ACTN|nr:single-stranded DNA-binding protein [Actinomadura violacea]MBO2464999.1 single-stranded DNA-binding protein [Actinomadura violacea]